MTATRSIKSAIAGAAMMLVAAESASAAAIDHNDIWSSWTHVRPTYLDGQGVTQQGWTLQPNWLFSRDGAESGFLSNFNLGDGSISGSFTATNSDDDQIAIVFGMQGTDFTHGYRFVWDAFNANDGLGSNVGQNGDDNRIAGNETEVQGRRVFVSNGAVVNNVYLAQDPAPDGAVGYLRNVQYDFSFGRSGDVISFQVSTGGNLVWGMSAVDTTYMTGRVGFYTSSEPGVRFFGLAEDGTHVPEPATLALAGIGAAALGARASRRRATD